MERRQFRRKKFRAPVDYPSADWPYRHFTENISAGGLQIHTVDRIEPGVKMTFTFSAGEAETVDITGEVVHSGSEGLGIRFLPVTSEQKKVLISMFDHIEEQ